MFPWDAYNYSSTLLQNLRNDLPDGWGGGWRGWSGIKGDGEKEKGKKTKKNKIF